MIMSGIAINQSNLNEHAIALKNAANIFNEEELGSIDNESTISAIQNGQSIFQEVQHGHRFFSQALVQSGEQMITIGERFFTIDEQAANVMKN